MTSPYPYAQPPAAYPPQQPGYAPPQAYAQPPAAYAPAPGYAPQQYAPPQQYAAPAPPPAARGTIDDFYSQPGGGSGKPLNFTGKPPGTTYRGTVARAVTNADILQQTDRNKVPLTHKDGRPKFVMVVPLIVAQSPEYPEGMASWWVKGQPRDELSRAMAAAGAPEGAPEAGAVIDITFTGERQIPGFNAQRIFAINYQRPQGNGQAPQAPAPQPHPMSPQGQPGYATDGRYGPPASPGTDWSSPQFPGQPQAPVQPQYQQPMAPPPQQYAPAAALSPEQHAAQMQQGQYPLQGQAPPPPPQGQYPAPPQAQQGQVPGLDPAQQAILARLQAQQQQG